MQMRLSSEPRIPDGLLASMTPLSGKPRLGFAASTSTPHPGFWQTQTTTALGDSRSVVSGTRWVHEMGRWMSPDPYDGSMDLGNPQSLNRYNYVLNNPLRFTDPTGLDCHGDPTGCGGGGDGGSWFGIFIDIGQAFASLFHFGHPTLTGSPRGPQARPNVRATSTYGQIQVQPDGTYTMTASYQVPQYVAPGQDIPLDPYAAQVIAGVAQRTASFPDICSGGGFVYAGVQREIGNYHGFAGYLGNYDSAAGGSNNFLLEGAGKHVGGAGAVGSQGIEALAFVPLAGEGGGLVGLSKEGLAFGAYLGTPERFPVGVGGGGYFNISSMGNCRRR